LVPPRRHSAGLLLAALVLAAVVAAGCAARPALVLPSAPLQTASLDQLVTAFNHNADAIRTMSVKLELTAHVGKVAKPRVSGYLLTEKPSSIRIWGGVPLLGREFDMASNGTDFELSIPARSKFYEGQNAVIPENVGSPLEKLRPQIILNALLTNPIDGGDHTLIDPDSKNGEYDVLVLHTGRDSQDHVVRDIIFSRTDLLPKRQILYDADGVHTTVATYGKFVVHDSIPFATDITIARPVDAYALHLQIDKNGITFNQPFSGPNPFVLAPPQGYSVIKLSANGEAPGRVGSQ